MLMHKIFSVQSQSKSCHVKKNVSPQGQLGNKDLLMAEIAKSAHEVMATAVGGLLKASERERQGRESALVSAAVLAATESKVTVDIATTAAAGKAAAGVAKAKAKAGKATAVVAGTESEGREEGEGSATAAAAGVPAPIRAEDDAEVQLLATPTPGAEEQAEGGAEAGEDVPVAAKAKAKAKLGKAKGKGKKGVAKGKAKAGALSTGEMISGREETDKQEGEKMDAERTEAEATKVQEQVDAAPAEDAEEEGARSVAGAEGLPEGSPEESAPAALKTEGPPPEESAVSVEEQPQLEATTGEKMTPTDVEGEAEVVPSGREAPAEVEDVVVVGVGEVSAESPSEVAAVVDLEAASPKAKQGKLKGSKGKGKKGLAKPKGAKVAGPKEKVGPKVGAKVGAKVPVAKKAKAPTEAEPEARPAEAAEDVASSPTGSVESLTAAPPPGAASVSPAGDEVPPPKGADEEPPIGVSVSGAEQIDENLVQRGVQAADLPDEASADYQDPVIKGPTLEKLEQRARAKEVSVAREISKLYAADMTAGILDSVGRMPPPPPAAGTRLPGTGSTPKAPMKKEAPSPTKKGSGKGKGKGLPVPVKKEGVVDAVSPAKKSGLMEKGGKMMKKGGKKGGKLAPKPASARSASGGAATTPDDVSDSQLSSRSRDLRSQAREKRDATQQAEVERIKQDRRDAGATLGAGTALRVASKLHLSAERAREVSRGVSGSLIKSAVEGLAEADAARWPGVDRATVDAVRGFSKAVVAKATGGGERGRETRSALSPGTSPSLGSELSLSRSPSSSPGGKKGGKGTKVGVAAVGGKAAKAAGGKGAPAKGKKALAGGPALKGKAGVPKPAPKKGSGAGAPLVSVAESAVPDGEEEDVEDFVVSGMEASQDVLQPAPPSDDEDLEDFVVSGASKESVLTADAAPRGGPEVGDEERPSDQGGDVGLGVSADEQRLATVEGGDAGVVVAGATEVLPEETAPAGAMTTSPEGGKPSPAPSAKGKGAKSGKGKVGKGGPKPKPPFGKGKSAPASSAADIVATPVPSTARGPAVDSMDDVDEVSQSVPPSPEAPTEPASAEPEAKGETDLDQQPVPDEQPVSSPAAAIAVVASAPEELAPELPPTPSATLYEDTADPFAVRGDLYDEHRLTPEQRFQQLSRTDKKQTLHAEEMLNQLDSTLNIAPAKRGLGRESAARLDFLPVHRQFQAQSSPVVDVQPGHLPLRKTQTVGAELSPRPPGSLRKDPVWREFRLSERSRTSAPVGGGTMVQRPSGRRGDGVVDGRSRFVVREWRQFVCSWADRSI